MVSNSVNRMFTRDHLESAVYSGGDILDTWFIYLLSDAVIQSASCYYLSLNCGFPSPFVVVILEFISPIRLCRPPGLQFVL